MTTCMRCILMLCCLSLYATSYAQHADTLHHEHHGMKGSHRLTLGLGHTNISEGQKEGKTEWIVLPSWSLSYDYWLSDRWGIGLETDIVLETFVVEDGDQELLERERPLSVVPVALYKPGANWTFIGGVGTEYAKEQTMALTRLGVEYGVHLPNNWEVGATAFWDNKLNYYNSWGLAFTVSKIFSPNAH